MAHHSNQPAGYGHGQDDGGGRPFPRPHQPASDFRRSGTFPPLSALVSGANGGGSTTSAGGSASGGSSSSLTGSSSGGHGYGHGHWGPAPPPPWAAQSHTERPQLPPMGGMTLPQPSGSTTWAYASSPPPPHPTLPSPTATRSPATRSPAGFHPHLARGEGRSPTGATGHLLSYGDPGSVPPKTVPSPGQSSWREAPQPYYPHAPPSAASFASAHSTLPPYAHGPTSQPLPPPLPSQSPQSRQPPSGYGASLPPTGATHPTHATQPFSYHPPPPPPSASPHYHAPHLPPYPPPFAPAYPPPPAPHGSSPSHVAGYSGMPAPYAQPHSHPHAPAGPQSPPSDRRAPPPSASPSTSTLQDSERPRQARNLACEFCRQRKLRCIVDDGNKSCRQCLRREKDCSLPTAPVDEAPSVPKATKKRRAADDAAGKAPAAATQKKSRKKQGSPGIGSASGSGSQSVDAGQTASTSHHISAPHQASGSNPNSLAMMLHAHQGPTQEDAQQLLALNAATFDGGNASNDSFHSALGGDAQDDSIETIDRSDLLSAAMPPQPRTVIWNWDPNWWDRCLSFFGERSQSIRIVENLLSRFVTKHAALTGIFHATSFVDLVRRPEKRQTAQPALIFAALAAAVCDLNLDKQEPYTADVAAADANGKRLIQQLRASADEYIEATLATPNAQTIPLAQAATVMALTETRTPGRRRLFEIADFVIRSLGVLDSNIILPADEKLICADRNVIQYDRPRLFGPSAEGEIAAEMASRLAKAPMGLVVRDVLQRPDEDDPNLIFPDYSPYVRPFDFWAPSQLPEVLPETYHLSTHIARAGATITRAYGRVSRFPPHGGASNEDIYNALKDLEEFENVVPWMRSVDQEKVTAIFPQSVQALIIKLAVFTRMSLWRKTKAWTLNGALLRADAQGGGNPPMLASFQWWFELLRERIQSLEADSSRHLASGVDLQASDGEIDSALRHVCLALQILSVLPRPPTGVRQLLEDALATLQMHVNLRATNPASSSLGQRIEQVREDVRRFGTPSPQGTSPEVGSKGGPAGGIGSGWDESNGGGGGISSLEGVAAADSATLSSVLQGHVGVPGPAASATTDQQQQQSQLGVQLLPTTTAAM